MSVQQDIRYERLARLSPHSTGTELRSVCKEAGMFAIRARRKIATEKDFIKAINKAIKAYAKFSSTPRYMTYNWMISVAVVFLNSFLFHSKLVSDKHNICTNQKYLCYSRRTFSIGWHTMPTKINCVIEPSTAKWIDCWFRPNSSNKPSRRV